MCEWRQRKSIINRFRAISRDVGQGAGAMPPPPILKVWRGHSVVYPPPFQSRVVLYKYNGQASWVTNLCFSKHLPENSLSNLARPPFLLPISLTYITFVSSSPWFSHRDYMHGESLMAKWTTCFPYLFALSYFVGDIPSSMLAIVRYIWTSIL